VKKRQRTEDREKAMLVFPQLVTGAAALYPLTKRLVRRTAVNDLSDGSKVMLEDPDAATSDWELRAKGLTETEAAAIEALFDAAAGRWKTFTFLDPAGNLLANSEEFDAPTWSNGPLVQLTPGIGIRSERRARQPRSTRGSRLKG
jgi:hypothetical protein